MNDDRIKRAVEKIKQTRERVDSPSHINRPTPDCGIAGLPKVQPKPTPRTTSEKKEK